MNPLAPIVLSLLLIVGVGVLFNNSAASGLGNPVTMACNQAGAPLDTCQNSSSVGCQLDPAQCSLSGTSISFLSGNSPFTDVIQGNILGLFQNLNGQNSATQHGPFDVTGQGQFYTVNCQGSYTKGTDEWQNFNFDAGCTQTDNGNANLSQSAAVSFLNWNPALSGVSKTLALFHLVTNATHFFHCQAETQINYTAIIGYSYYGCDEVVGTVGNLAIPGIPHWSMMLAIPNQIIYRLNSTAYMHFSIFAQPQNWDALFCAQSQEFPSNTPPFLFFPQCQNFFTSTAGVSTGGLTSFNWGFLTPLIAFALGIVLFIIGLNMTISAGGSIIGTGTSFLVGTGSQGARLAQSMGVGLLVFAPLYSEFIGPIDSWVSVLPNGLAVIVPIILAGFFFFGCYQLAMSTNSGE